MEPLSPPAVPAAPPPSAAAIAYLCVACGTQYAPSAAPPAACPICEDDRQYVPPEGQRWTTLDALRATHRNVLTEVEPGLTSLRTDRPFAIHHQAMLIDSGAGLILWDCNALADEATAAELRARGQVRALALSHPHFYTAMVEWSRLLGGVPIYLHAADARWIGRPDPAIQLWEGATHPLPGGLSLIHTGGHFAGSQSLLWPGGAAGKGALFVGDDPSVCADRRFVTFMHSFPNHVPLGPAAAERVVAALRPHPFDRLYGWRPGLVIAEGAKACLERSLARHLAALRGRAPEVPAAAHLVG